MYTVSQKLSLLCLTITLTYMTIIHLMVFFQDNLGKPAPER